MKLKKLIKKINKENTPPDGWKAADAVSKAINWDKLKDPEVLKELEKIFQEKEDNDFLDKQSNAEYYDEKN